MVTKAKPKSDEAERPDVRPWEEARTDIPPAIAPSIFLGQPQVRPTGDLVDEAGEPTTLKAALGKKETDSGTYVVGFDVYEKFLAPGSLPGYETVLLLVPAGHRVTQEWVDSLKVGER